MVVRRYQSRLAREQYRRRVELGLSAYERTIASRYMTPPGCVLNVGCGAGREALGLHALGHQVTAIDSCPEQVEAARKSAETAGVDLAVELCNGERLDFADASFDYVVAWAQVLANVPGHVARGVLVRDCARVLRPGGRFSFTVHDRDRTEDLARQQGLRPEGGFELEDGDVVVRDEEDGPCYWHYFTRDEIVGLCAQAALEVLELGPVTEFGGTWHNVWACIAQR